VDAQGVHIPLVADMHFNRKAAMIAARRTTDPRQPRQLRGRPQDFRGDRLRCAGRRPLFYTRGDGV